MKYVHTTATWSLLIFIFHLGIKIPLQGQSEKGMLIFQIDGNRYIQKNFNKENELQSYQIMEIGITTETDGKIITNMTVNTYEKDGSLKGTSATDLVCTPESRQVLMGLFPFTGKKAKISTIIKMKDSAILYPVDWRKMKTLDDFKIDLKFKGGAVGFFGTNSSILITNRQVMPSVKEFGIKGKMTIKAYVLGIKVSTVNYDYFEEIDLEKGIVRQKFTEDNGEYFTVEIID